MTVLEPGQVPDGMFSAELAAAAATGLNVVEIPRSSEVWQFS
jgi:hypothetical protein